MYIRRTKTKAASHGEDSSTYRIVESVRVGTQVKQRTILNLGKDFAIEPAHWPLLTARIEQFLQGSAPHQAELFALADDLGQLLEAAAERYSDLIIAKLAQPVATETPEQDYHTVDINHIEAVQARSIGVETLAWHAVMQLQLDQKLAALGFNKIDSAAALGSIIGRMVSPGSELQTHDWLQSRTGLGELLGHDYGSTSLTRLYKISDKLLQHQSALEAFLAPVHWRCLGRPLQGKNPVTVKPVVIMDAGIASAANIAWLIEHGYQYLVVSRERHAKDPRDQDSAIMVRKTGHNSVAVYREIDAETGETRLYCHSELKAKKEQGIRNRFHVRLEEALAKLNAGLDKKGTVKNYVKILERIGRLREKNSRVASDYRIEVTADADKNNAIRIEWQRESQSDQKDQHCGVYCLRTNIKDWSEQQLWSTYTLLTEIEATFRSLKTDLGLRPVFHQKEARVTGHLFITLLAYHLVHTLRYQLKQQGIHLSWDSIRNLMSTQQRLTITLPTDDGKTIHLRTTTQAEVRQKQLYNALNIKSDPIGKCKTIIDHKKSVVPFDGN